MQLAVRPLPIRWIAAVLTLLLVGWTGQAAVRAIVAHPRPVAISRAVPRKVISGPEAIAFTATSAAPAAGTTGTTALPAMPVPAAYVADPLDGTVRPAAPFSMRLASRLDHARALDCLATAVYYEAASESLDGQRAVAQVILNRVRHPAFPATVCGVVFQGSEAHGCQFSFACDGAMARAPSRAGWVRALGVAALALNGDVFAPVGLATHYHTYAVTPAWNRALVMTDAVGAHFFHRWKGYWGTAAAFHQRYAGGEPLPGPHPGASDVGTPPVTIAVGGTPTLAPPALAPDIALSAPMPVTDAHTDAHTDAGQVLDRWKDTGQPLK